MRTSNITGALAFVGLAVVAVSITGCSECCDPPPACRAAGAACQKTCSGPWYECIQQGDRLVCGSPGPCDPAQHCEPPLPCFITTCSFSKRLSGAGVYTCTEDVCCKTTPADSGSKCPAPADPPGDQDSWTGVCDGAGVCNAP